jgi:2,3-diaminopropionate biosynthesis protein SbnB
MAGDSLLIVRGDEVAELLADREAEIVEAVRRAYRAHAAGQSSLPHSTFVRLPGDEINRIIALPAFLGDGFGVAGVKWIASFPGNVQRGINRATAVLVLNSTQTGEPEAILEGSIISAKRTAASAAAAAMVLLAGGSSPSAGLIGTGTINFEVARFLRAVLPDLSRFRLFDLDAVRADRFAAALRRDLGVGEVEIAPDVAGVLAASRLVSFATTAIRPHVEDLSPCPPGAVILHISLRDLSPSAILANDNVVDDADHVCRVETSIHLAKKLAGSRSFIRCTLATSSRAGRQRERTLHGSPSSVRSASGSSTWPWASWCSMPCGRTGEVPMSKPFSRTRSARKVWCQAIHRDAPAIARKAQGPFLLSWQAREPGGSITRLPHLREARSDGSGIFCRSATWGARTCSA